MVAAHRVVMDTLHVRLFFVLWALPSSRNIPMPTSIVDGFNKKFSSYQVLQQIVFILRDTCV